MVQTLIMKTFVLFLFVLIILSNMCFVVAVLLIVGFDYNVVVVAAPQVDEEHVGLLHHELDHQTAINISINTQIKNKIEIWYLWLS